MTEHQPLVINSDNYITLEGLKDSTNNQFINTATVTVTVYSPANVALSGTSWPVTMSYVASSNGNYRGILPATLVVNKGETLTAKVTATVGGLSRVWDFDVVVLRS
jgi:hypothetical protein